MADQMSAASQALALALLTAFSGMAVSVDSTDLKAQIARIDAPNGGAATGNDGSAENAGLAEKVEGPEKNLNELTETVLECVLFANRVPPMPKALVTVFTLLHSRSIGPCYLLCELQPATLICQTA